MYIVLIFTGKEGFALVSALLSILFLFFHSVASFTKGKEFFFYPIKSYVKKLNNGIDSEIEIYQKLKNFSCEALTEAKNITENERDRIKNNVTFLSGTIDKVGLFPSLLAFIYAFQKYQSSLESGMFAYVLLGLILGIYFGVLLLQQITNWQNNSIYLLNKTIQLKNENNLS